MNRVLEELAIEEIDDFANINIRRYFDAPVDVKVSKDYGKTGVKTRKRDPARNLRTSSETQKRVNNCQLGQRDHELEPFLPKPDGWSCRRLVDWLHQAGAGIIAKSSERK